MPIGHTASYYYVGKSPITAFGTALPFGLTSRQQDAWLYEGGGLEMLQEVYAEKFNTIQFPAGNTGVQMGGWFNKEINSVADMKGLKMRIPGLGGKVMDRLGVAATGAAALGVSGCEPSRARCRCSPPAKSFRPCRPAPLTPPSGSALTTTRS